MRSIFRARRVVLAAAVLALSALAAGTAGAKTGGEAGTAAKPKKPNPNAIAALVAKSKTESGLVVYGNPPAANFNALVAKFNAAYPWIKVTEYDLDDSVIFSKYASEAAQGTRTADLLIASAPNLWVYAARKGYAMNFTPIGIQNYPKWAQQYKGIFVMSPDPAIIVYNKLLLKDKVPNSLTEIANDASTYGKLTGYTVDNTFGYTGLYGYVQLRGWGNLEKIGKRMKAGGNVAAQLQLVSQGGAVLTYLTSPTARFRIANDSNLAKILDWSYIKDAQPLVPRGIGVTKKASSPASAKLFLDFVYSKAGQQAMCEAGFTAFMNKFRAANGCANTLAAVYAAVGAKRVYNPGFTQKFVNDRPGFARRWHGIFG
jgi:iron(III) transport system substrate-binding protein